MYVTPTRLDTSNFDEAAIEKLERAAKDDSDLANLEWRVVEAAIKWRDGHPPPNACCDREEPLASAIDALISAREANETNTDINRKAP